MKLKPGSYFLIFLILVALIFVVYSMTFPPIQGKLVGVMAGSIIIILGVIQLINEIIKANKPGAQLPGSEEVRSFYKRSGLLAVWVGGFAITTYILGFLVSIPLFLLSYLKTQRTGWLLTILIGVIVTGAIYGIFEVFLERELWRGFIAFP